jgi:hypothetical protein
LARLRCAATFDAIFGRIFFTITLYKFLKETEKVIGDEQVITYHEKISRGLVKNDYTLYQFW